MLVLPINFFRIYLYIFQCASLYFRLLYFFVFIQLGGGKESRTPDLLLARQAL